jgi:hypothetical protein
MADRGDRPELRGWLANSVEMIKYDNKVGSFVIHGRKIMKHFASVLLLSAFGLAACGPQEPLKVGFIGGLSDRIRTTVRVTTRLA